MKIRRKDFVENVIKDLFPNYSHEPIQGLGIKPGQEIDELGATPLGDRLDRGEKWLAYNPKMDTSRREQVYNSSQYFPAWEACTEEFNDHIRKIAVARAMLRNTKKIKSELALEDEIATSQIYERIDQARVYFESRADYLSGIRNLKNILRLGRRFQMESIMEEFELRRIFESNRIKNFEKIRIRKEIGESLAYNRDQVVDIISVIRWDHDEAISLGKAQRKKAEIRHLSEYKITSEGVRNELAPAGNSAVEDGDLHAPRKRIL